VWACGGLGFGLGVLLGGWVNGDHRRRRRVSGSRAGGNDRRGVEKCGWLWRTCGRADLRGDCVGFGRVGVEIFCSTWNILRMKGDHGFARMARI